MFSQEVGALEFELLNPAHQESIQTFTFYWPTDDESTEEDESAIGQAPVEPETEEIDPLENSPAIRDFYGAGLHLSPGVFMGIGKIYYETDETEYRVYYNPRGARLDASYSVKQFHIGIFGSIEADYYQTSFLQEEMNYFSNIDKHPRTKYTFGASLGYHIPLHRILSIMPYGHAGITSHNNAAYIPDNVNHPEEGFTISSSSQLGVGGQLNLLATKRMGLYVRIQYSSLKFEPDGFFPLEFTSKNNLTTFGMGVIIKAF